MKLPNLAAALAVLLVVSAQATIGRAADPPLAFSCTTFPPDLTEGDLRARFGDSHVATALVPWGGAEGDYNQGTAVFGDTPNAKVEIYWRDRIARRDVQWIRVRGDGGPWRTPGGIRLGMDLKSIEQLNGRPFRLIGFATDVEGMVMSWGGGRLAAQDRPDCRVRVRFRPKDMALTLMRQVLGEREFSSGHPAMQALNPAVCELVMSYAR